jgi:hypothetical protein
MGTLDRWVVITLRRVPSRIPAVAASLLGRSVTLTSVRRRGPRRDAV